MPIRMAALILVGGAVISGHSAVAAADLTLFETGFESPGYVAGQQLGGQGLWSVDSAWNVNAPYATISTTGAATGNQCLRLDGAGMVNPFPPGTSAIWGVYLQATLASPFRPLDAGLPVLILEADVFVQGLSSSGFLNLQLRGSQSFGAQAAIGPSGDLGAYHHLMLTANYATQRFSTQVDGNVIGPPESFFWYDSGDISSVVIFFGAQMPHSSVCLIDNLSLRAVPAAPEGALLGCAAWSLLTRRRRPSVRCLS